MANKRLTEAGFIESIDDGGSFFVNKNNSVRQIDKSDIIFGIKNGGTGATDAETARKNLGAAAIDHIHTAESMGVASKEHVHDASEIASGDIAIERLGAITPQSIGAAYKSMVETATFSFNGNTNVIVNVSGVTSDNHIIVTPSPSSYLIWCECQIRAVSQGNGNIEFQCEESPSENVTANILIVG